jgi:hypothetical protein
MQGPWEPLHALHQGILLGPVNATVHFPPPGVSEPSGHLPHVPFPGSVRMAVDYLGHHLHMEAGGMSSGGA